MTVSSEVNHEQYDGNGTTTVFPYRFRILKDTHITVMVIDAAENLTTLALNTDYDLTGVGLVDGGNVVLRQPLAAGWRITLDRELPAVQETDLRNQGKFFAETHEDTFDYLTMLIQQAFSTFRLALRRPSWLSKFYDALGFNISNLADPKLSQDAATKKYVDAADAVLAQQAVANLQRTLRVPESFVNQVPAITGRRNSLFGFDSNGDPLPVFAMTATADLAVKLASHEYALGGALVGLYPGGNVQQAIDYVFPEAFGTAYDDARLQAAMNYAAANGKRLLCTGRTFTLNAIVTLPSTLSADFTGSVIIAGAAITAGSAIMVQGDTSIASGQYSGTIHNLLLLRTLVGGHADPSSNVDGLSFGVSGSPQGMKWYNLRIYGFRDGLRFDGPNSYINHFYMADIGNHWRRGVAVYATSNSNENYHFSGGRIFNVNNTSFNGTGIYIDQGASKTDINLNGVSIDYCDYSAQLYQSYLYMINCHLENNNNNPHILLSYTSSKEFPSVVMVGGDMAGGPGGTDVWTGIPVERSGGRDAYIYVINSGGNNVTVNRTRIGNYSVTNPRRTQLLKVQGNNPNVLNVIDLKPVLTAGNTDSSSRPIRLCNAINSIVVSQYTLDSWTQTLSRDDGTITFSIDTGVYYDSDSPHSRKYVGTGGYSTGLYQEMACNGGQMININAFVMVSSLTAGYQALRIDFLDSKGNVINSSIKTNSEVSTVFKQLWVYMKAPNGAVKVRVQEYYNSFTGTAYFSNENVWVH